MNPQITSLPPVATSFAEKTILERNGFSCSLVTLAAGDATRCESGAKEQILFVVGGEGKVRSGELTTILNADEAMLLPKGKEHEIAAQPTGALKFLKVVIPPREIVTPPLVTL